MKTPRKARVAAAAAATVLPALLLIVPAGGCGGGANAPVAPGVVRFAGSWQGTWRTTAAVPERGGDLRLRIEPNGAFTGTIRTPAPGTDGTLSGTADDAGDYTGTLLYSDTFAPPVPVTGTWTLRGPDQLTGSFRQRLNGVEQDGEIDLSRQ
jgi:hypothetical protein